MTFLLCILSLLLGYCSSIIPEKIEKEYGYKNYKMKGIRFLLHAFSLSFITFSFYLIKMEIDFVSSQNIFNKNINSSYLLSNSDKIINLFFYLIYSLPIISFIVGLVLIMISQFKDKK